MNGGASNITMKNILYYDGSATASFTFMSPSTLNGVTADACNAGLTVCSNNTTSAQFKTNPLFLNTTGTMSAASDYKPTSTSYAIGTNNGCSSAPCATTVPVWSDMAMRPLTPASVRDLGALLH